jgi:alpha-glucosidase
MWRTELRLSAIVMRALLASSAVGVATQAGAVAPHLAHLRNGIELIGSAGSMRVTALTDSIIRVRVAKDGKFAEDASWAVPAAVRRESVRVAPTARGFRTASMELRVDPTTMKLQALDVQGKVISADSGPVRSDAHAFELRKGMPLSEHYFGMGDKTGVLDRRGYTFVNWNSDTYGFTPSTDPIYKSIPFFIATGGPGGSYGLFLDNTYRSTFDFGHSVADTLRISSVDGPIDYYLIAGPTVADVVHRYTDLTGHAPMAPLWALGYQQSRYSYMSDAEVRQIATTFRRERFPLDVIWLDID